MSQVVTGLILRISQPHTASLLFPLVAVSFFFRLLVSLTKRPQLSLGVRRICKSSCCWVVKSHKWSIVPPLFIGNIYTIWMQHGVETITTAIMVQWNMTHIGKIPCWVLEGEKLSSWKSKVGQLDGYKSEKLYMIEIVPSDSSLLANFRLVSGVFQGLRRSLHCFMFEDVQSKSSSTLEHLEVVGSQSEQSPFPSSRKPMPSTRLVMILPTLLGNLTSMG